MKLLDKIKENYKLENKKVSILLMILIVINVMVLVISNVIAIKNMDFFGLEVNGAKITLSSSIIAFPIIYILSDIFSEIYGYIWSRITCWLGFLMNLFFVIFCQITVYLPGSGSTALAFRQVFSISPGVLFSSLLAFIAGDFFNDVVFQALKNKDETNKVGPFVFRSLFSSLIGELVDTLIFLVFLYLFTNQYGTTIKNIWQFLTIVLIQAGVKTLFEVILVPVTVLLIRYIKIYEAKIADK